MKVPHTILAFFFMFISTLAIPSTGGALDGTEGQAWQELEKLTATDAAGGDKFGASVSISGNTAVVGSNLDDDACPPEDPDCDSGSAYVFARNKGGPGAWGELAKLTASDASTRDSFGGAVSIYGDLIVVGASGEDANDAVNSGSAYIFAFDQNGSNAWGETRKLTASDGAHSDAFGGSVAIHGSTVVVGAETDDDAGDFSGSAYVFEQDEGGFDEWGEVKKLVASDAKAGDRFGAAVAIDGDTIVVGGSGAGTDSVYIFERDQGGPGNWGEVISLAASDGALGGRFGVSVAISQDTVVVGAREDDDGGFASGSAYVFARDQGGPNNWGEVTKLIASDADIEDFFGDAVSISGNTIIVGARRSDDDVTGANSGSAYVFHRNQGGSDNWGEVIKLVADDAAFGDEFGAFVSIHDNTILIGANKDSNIGAESGSAYVFINILAEIFANGFETGGTSAWSSSVP